jgi:hypothetical protein
VVDEVRQVLEELLFVDGQPVVARDHPVVLHLPLVADAQGVVAGEVG